MDRDDIVSFSIICLIAFSLITIGFVFGKVVQEGKNIELQEERIMKSKEWKPSHVILLTPQNSNPNDAIWDTFTIPLDKRGFYSWYTLYKPTNIVMIYVE